VSSIKKRGYQGRNRLDQRAKNNGWTLKDLHVVPAAIIEEKGKELPLHRPRRKKGKSYK